LAIQNIVFFQGGDIGREVTAEIVVEVYLIRKPIRGSGSVVSFPTGVWV